jgi:hypothetical protein
VRYDPVDRSRIELDRRAFVEHEDAQERNRVAERIARGEQALGLSEVVTAFTPVGDEREPDAGSLRIGDTERDLIAEVLSQHMTDGRLTSDELEDRLGALYTSQTRAQARSVLADLPPLAAAGGEQRDSLAVLPDRLRVREAEVHDPPPSKPAARPNGVVVAPVPSNGELNTRHIGRGEECAGEIGSIAQTTTGLDCRGESAAVTVTPGTSRPSWGTRMSHVSARRIAVCESRQHAGGSSGRRLVRQREPSGVAEGPHAQPQAGLPHRLLDQDRIA